MIVRAKIPKSLVEGFSRHRAVASLGSPISMARQYKTVQRHLELLEKAFMIRLLRVLPFGEALEFCDASASGER